MQIPILNGVYAGADPELRTCYPINMVPVPKQSGISNGFLRPADGLIAEGAGPGIDRGGINWNGLCYRVMGTKLVAVADSGAVSVLGDVGSGGPVTMDYSFDRLAVASGGRLYYWNGTLTQVTDADLGVVLDVVWVDGYFMTTDGTYIAVTELLDPTQVNPLKYGASEIDPDPILGIAKLRNEIYVLNANTIEVFANVGGDFFPFQRIAGAQIQKGVTNTHGHCIFMDTLAFLGSGRNESPGIYLGANGNAGKISTREIDRMLAQYSVAELALVQLEARNDNSHQHLYIHLPDRTFVYDAVASAALEERVWFTLTSGTDGFGKYRARNFVWAYGRWLVGDPLSETVGSTTQAVSTHWGRPARWEFNTVVVYAGGKGAIFNELELVALTGRSAVGVNPIISTSYSTDGLSWSQDRPIRAGMAGNTNKRLLWLQQGHMRNWRIQRFRGDSQAYCSFVRLEVQLEGLAY